MFLAMGWPLEKTHSLKRLAALERRYGATVDLSDEEVVFVDSICRGRYPAEAGLLPFGEPSEEHAARALDIGGRVIGWARRSIS